MKIAQFQIPGNQTLPAPSGIPEALSGGLQISGGVAIRTAINLLFALAGLLTIIFIIISGIQWITSGGDPGKIVAARARLMYAVIGLVIVALSFFIVSVVFGILGVPIDFF